MLSAVKKTIQLIKQKKLVSQETWKSALGLYHSDACLLLSQTSDCFNFIVPIEDGSEQKLSLLVTDEAVIPQDKTDEGWGLYSLTALFQLMDKLSTYEITQFPGKRYTRNGMKQRVLAERKQKADNADYRIQFANNIFGEHILTNERGIRYRITLRDFENETGYIDSPDLRANKLGTTKHIIYAFQKLKSDQKLFNKLSKEYPFVEIYLDPLNDYKITWYYPHKLEKGISSLIKDFFGEYPFFPEERTKDFLRFINRAENFEQILIRQEVLEKVEKVYNQEMLEELQSNYTIDLSPLKAKLFPYQVKGVQFALFREGAIIADEMGLGKTLQAISAAVLKKELFGFKRTLIVCPASLKTQWKNEIEKFTDEEAIVVEGYPLARAETYRDATAYFLIVNYETVLRDSQVINEYAPDFIILDEAQRIKNYNTKTAQSIKQLKRKHALVITGTPIENRLIDLYSIVQFVDPYFLSPLWEFSYQHCYFDTQSDNKIIGYYNLQALKERMQQILLRREKRNVIKELPNVQQMNVPVNLHPRQAEYHASYASGIAAILRKKFKTPYDWQRLMLLLTNMRMVCNSTFLVDKETNYSPKLQELRYILLEKLDLTNNNRKVIIFSEWIRTHYLIAEMLKNLNIGFVELSGKVPAKKRSKLIKEFEDNDECRVFLSTEAGGAGLNLQVADTVINFELPWNPAKKNQRIGRIDRIGQQASKLTVINLVARDSIETRIAAGLLLKQNLFEGVLDTDSNTDEVDFSEKGRAQFLNQLEEIIQEFEEPVVEELIEEEIMDAEQVTDNLFEEEEPVEAPSASVSGADQIPQPDAAGVNGGRMQQQRFQQMEAVMNQGLNFLAGLYKLSTGQDMGSENQKIEIDQETGEVVMRFKLKI